MDLLQAAANTRYVGAAEAIMLMNLMKELSIKRFVYILSRAGQ